MSPQDFSPIVTLTNLEVEGEDFRLSSEPSHAEEANQEGRESPDQQSDTFAPLSPLSSALEASPPVVDWSDRVDVYADRLMDEIFNPVEHTLESGAAPLEFEETEVLRIRSLEMPNLSLPAALVPRMDAYSPQADSALAVISAEEIATPSPLINRLLLGSVLLSCAITLGWWAINRDRYDVLLSASPEAPLSVPEPATVSPDAQFAAYLQDSLKTLDTQTQGKSPSTSNPAEATSTGTTLPSVPATLPTVPDTATATLPTVTVPGTPSLGDSQPPARPCGPVHRLGSGLHSRLSQYPRCSRSPVRRSQFPARSAESRAPLSGRWQRAQGQYSRRRSPSGRPRCRPQPNHPHHPKTSSSSRSPTQRHPFPGRDFGTGRSVCGPVSSQWRDPTGSPRRSDRFCWLDISRSGQPRSHHSPQR